MSESVHEDYATEFEPSSYTMLQSAAPPEFARGAAQEIGNYADLNRARQLFHQTASDAADSVVEVSPRDAVVAEPELRVGAHIVSRRHGYTHHGIYVGAGKVVHYAGLSRGLRRGPVEEISLSGFSAGYPVGVVSSVPPRFDGPEVVRRARSRVGEDNYRLLTNNCEHFCEWCLRGQHRSYQIDTCLAFPSRALHATRRLISELLSRGHTPDPSPRSVGAS